MDELEKRMRPGAYSGVGFLGSTESLEEVLRQDKLTLQQLRLSCKQISAELKKIFLDAIKQEEKSWEDAPQKAIKREEQEGRLINWCGTSIFSSDNLPDPTLGFIVGSKYQVFLLQSKGIQQCPWDCVLKRDLHWSSIDFLLLNRTSGHSIIMPGLIVHLIQKHHFFEGKESPYRVEPIHLATVLELVPSE